MDEYLIRLQAWLRVMKETVAMFETIPFAEQAAAQKEQGVAGKLVDESKVCYCGPIDQMTTAGLKQIWETNPNCPIHGGTASVDQPAQEPVAVATEYPEFLKLAREKPITQAKCAHETEQGFSDAVQLYLNGKWLRCKKCGVDLRLAFITDQLLVPVQPKTPAESQS